MAALFDLSVLGAIVAVLLLLGSGAVSGGADSRPGFGEDNQQFPEHHNSVGGSF